MSIDNKKIYLVKIPIAYLTILSLIASIILLSQILRIIEFLNIPALLVLTVDLFISAINIIFLFKKNTQKDIKLVLIYNIVFCIISGILVRIGGYPFANNLGADFSIGYIQNYAANTYVVNGYFFNMLMNFPDKIQNFSGFSFQINLIIWGIGTLLIVCYKRIDRWFTTSSEPSTNPNLTP